MTTTASTTETDQLSRLYHDLESEHLNPLWTQLDSL